MREAMKVRGGTFAVLPAAVVILIATPPQAFAQEPPVREVTYLDQGWSKEMREQFYFAAQGSQLIPLDWFFALEQGDSTELFSSRRSLSRFGYLFYEGPPGKLNPAGLPIGFTVEPSIAPGGGNWMGMTCAACHTGNVSYRGKLVRIDGAPAMADFGLFLNSLSSTVMANHPSADKEKFERFAKRVLGTRMTSATASALAADYAAFAIRFTGRAYMRTPPLHAGPGRVDALTQIVNSLAVFDLGRPENLYPPSAPTSYPFLWLTPKLDWVQWNPIASNPLARNAGQVMGVFGTTNLGVDPAAPLFTSSALLSQLFALEQWINDLKPPAWREDLFGTIDEAKWRSGAQQFQSNCRSCHNMPPFDMTKKEENIAGVQFIKITRVPYQEVGTDPTYMRNLLGRFVETGMLGKVLFNDAAVVPGAVFFTSAVGATLAKGLADAQLSPQQMLQYNGFRFYPKNDPKDPNEKLRTYSPPSLNGLKAGPLLGIWATGPYLHNASVPNVYELLSPPEERSKTFWVGSDELDVEKLGFVSSERPELFRFDTSLPGNQNSGHVYPKRPLTHEQKMAIIEFLKDPQRFAQEGAQ
jgi:hypothetical protein